ncbi:MAG: hypothetical protein U7M05_07605 [Candidatus Igneacidithiobacillus chanchocoensis]
MNAPSLAQKVWNFYHTLRRAFASQLVRQDPNDERAAPDAVKKPRICQAKEAA